jgi:hypothetical protein
MLIMTVGKGSRYRLASDQSMDPKPDFDCIVNIVKKVK